MQIYIFAESPSRLQKRVGVLLRVYERKSYCMAVRKDITLLDLYRKDKKKFDVDKVRNKYNEWIDHFITITRAGLMPDSIKDPEKRKQYLQSIRLGGLDSKPRTACKAIIEHPDFFKYFGASEEFTPGIFETRKFKIVREIELSEFLQLAMKDTADVKRNKPSVADCSCCVTQSETRLAATGKEIVSAVVGYNDISVAEGYEIMSTVVGEHGIVSADGTNSTASAIGYSSLSFASGKIGISTATAGLSMAVNASTLGIAASTGNVGNAYVSKDFSIACATGKDGSTTALGNGSMACTTSLYGRASAEEPDVIAAAWGPYASARGVVGSYLLLSEWDCDEEEMFSRRVKKDCHWRLVGTKIVRVDGETIKENIWYSLSNREIEEDVVYCRGQRLNGEQLEEIFDD